MRRNTLVVVFIFCCPFSILTSNALAGIFIANADATWEVELKSVTVTSTVTTTSRIFVNNADAIFRSDLTEPPWSPHITLSALSHDFGTVKVTSSSDWILRISNANPVPLTISSLSSDHPDFAVDDSSFTVLQEESKEVRITFSPSSVGRKQATLSIQSNDPDRELVTIALTGEGVTPEIEVSASDLEFGEVSVGTSVQRDVVITNRGSGFLDIASLRSTNARFVVGRGTVAVSPDSSVHIGVTFSPTQPGMEEGLLVIQSNDLDEGVVNVSLSGMGNDLPHITLEDIRTEQSDDVILYYKLSDMEKDTLSIVCEYQIGGRWVQATMKGKTEGIDRLKYSG